MRKSYSMNTSGEESVTETNRLSSSSQQPLLLINSLRSFQNEGQMSKAMEHQVKDKFRGCLVGALVGDCIGTLFECDYSVSYTILADLYLSLTNLSEDEKLMDLHGIDFSLGPKVAQELLERKQNQRASMTTRPSTERTSPPKEEVNKMKRHSATLEKRRGSFSRPIEKFSDDTVMTRSVVKSLIRVRGFDVRDLTKQLTEDYFLNLTRKFGAFTRDIFTQLRDTKYSDPQGPAKKSVNNIGSLGNESASRSAPIAAFAWNSEQTRVIELATKLSRITNYNKSGVNGAVFQALAVHTAFNWNINRERDDDSSSQGRFKRSTPSPCSSPFSSRKSLFKKVQENIPMEESKPKGEHSTEFDYREFCLRILERVTHVENRSVSILENLKSFMNPTREASKGEPGYSDKLRTIMEFLDRCEPPSRSEVVEKLGNGVKAVDSVPTALYSFLLSASCEKFPELPVTIKSPVLRSIFYAISLGGDCDTIASMAGAIAGAFWGYEQIPNEILRVCEGSKETVKLADELFNICR